MLYNYLNFFALIAFIITCCMMLFIEVFSRSLDLALTEENISEAARLTFINVVFLGFVFTVIDIVRRHFMVHRPAKKIIKAAERIMQGDFTARVPKIRSINPEDEFIEIADGFNKMAAELSGMETLRSDFIANVSHELKTPLAVMNNYARLLQAPELSEEQRIEYAKEISGASSKLADLVTNILRLNKLENQQIIPSAQYYDLSEQLREAMLGFESVWEKKQLVIEAEIEDGVSVKADPEMMSLVWNNLISNAIKFTDCGGKVSLGLSLEGEYAVIKVADTGCGISKETGAHIFDKFYQGDTSRSTQGNGLGLALVKRIIDLTGCDISVESEIGKGTVFTVKMKEAKKYL